MEEVQNSPVRVEEIAVSFFNLLENILKLDGLASTTMVFNQLYHHKYVASRFGDMVAYVISKELCTSEAERLIGSGAYFLFL